MSKIEVNQISSQCGSTLTIGQSGDTVTLACGATQSGFGRSGSVNWDTTAKTAAFTAVSGNGYFVNTTSGTVTMTLPASPSAGDIVAINDYARTFATNNLTVDRNGSNIQGTASNATFSTDGQSTTFVYVDGTKGWIPTEDQTTNVYGATYITASGGTVTTIGDFKVHAFTGPGTFTVCSVGNPAGGSDTIETMIVAGGGGAGFDRAGGAGAGGMILTPTCGIPVSVTSYPIAIGGGGAGIPNSLGPGAHCGCNGSNSTGFALTAIGGGSTSRGGNSMPAPQVTGNPGGSGGGGGSGCGAVGTGGTATQPTQPGNSGTFGFGNVGGNATPAPDNQTGGGGGAGAAGSNGVTGVSSGDGGAGKDVSPRFGTAPQPFYQADGPLQGASASGIFAGGGGGGGSGPGGPGSGGDGGTGGGGHGGDSPGNPGDRDGHPGTANTGGGGGGSSNISPSPDSGGNGGSGIVLIRYRFQN
jgi:hypothetical protein